MTYSLQNIALKIDKHATKLEMNTINISSHNFANILVRSYPTIENDIDNTEKFAFQQTFFNMLLNFLL